MTRKTWDTGNLFAVPLADGTWTCGQVVGREAEVLNSVTCAFYRSRYGSPDSATISAVPDESNLIAVLFTTKDLLTRRTWKVVGNHPVSVPRAFFPHEDSRAQGWVGAKVIGSGIVQHFLNAFFGLERWDQMKDAHYFDRLLLRPELNPFRGVGA